MALSGFDFGPCGVRFWRAPEARPGASRKLWEIHVGTMLNLFFSPLRPPGANLAPRSPPEAFRTPVSPPRGSILAGSILGLPVDQPCFPIFARLGCEHAGTSSAAGSTGIGGRGAAFRISLFWKTCLGRWFAPLFRTCSCLFSVVSSLFLRSHGHSRQRWDHVECSFHPSGAHRGSILGIHVWPMLNIFLTLPEPCAAPSWDFPGFVSRALGSAVLPNCCTTWQRQRRNIKRLKLNRNRRQRRSL